MRRIWTKCPLWPVPRLYRVSLAMRSSIFKDGMVSDGGLLGIERFYGNRLLTFPELFEILENCQSNFQSEVGRVKIFVSR